MQAGFDTELLDKDIYAAYMECGIAINQRTLRLAKVIIAEDVRREYTNLRKRGKTDQTGLLITILETVARGEKRHNASYADWEAEKPILLAHLFYLYFCARMSSG